MSILDNLTELTTQMNHCMIEGKIEEAAKLGDKIKELLGELKNVDKPKAKPKSKKPSKSKSKPKGEEYNPSSEGDSQAVVKKRGRPAKAKTTKPSKVKKASKTKSKGTQPITRLVPQNESETTIQFSKLVKEDERESVPGRIKGGTNLFEDNKNFFIKDKQIDKALSGNNAPQERREPAKKVTLTCSQCGRKVTMFESEAAYVSTSTFKSQFKCNSCGAPR